VMSAGELEAAVAATASSIDGRRFTFQAPVTGLELQPGGYALLGDRVGQVQEVEFASSDDVELTSGGGASRRISFVRGSGVVLTRESQPFHREPVVPAGEEDVAAWLEGVRPARAALDVGALVPQPRLRFFLDASGFDRHTFFCGQSGSGKTYALGTVLEQLLLRTTLRIVMLDPNSDFVRLDAVRDGVDEGQAAHYRSAAAGLEVRRGHTPSAERLHVRFVDCEPEEQAATLRLDPIQDVDEYGALVDMLDAGLETSTESTEVLARQLLESDRPDQRALGARLRNLGVHRWPIWSSGDEGSVQDLVATGGPRALVVDLGSLSTPGEKAIAGESVLAALWRRRAEREPTLIVIDEAQNVCPREPGDAVTALATEHAARIAAEGRKFGLYLLVATQRPQRVNELVLSQCDNLVLMRMASTSDLAYVAETLSFAPAPLLERATTFSQGESLVAGKIASHPAFVRFGPRIAEEGGGDVPTTWTQGAEL
jgi:DNA helicase HerA-like ATPase